MKLFNYLEASAKITRPLQQYNIRLFIMYYSSAIHSSNV